MLSSGFEALAGSRIRLRASGPAHPARRVAAAVLVLLVHPVSKPSQNEVLNEHDLGKLPGD